MKYIELEDAQNAINGLRGIKVNIKLGFKLFDIEEFINSNQKKLKEVLKDYLLNEEEFAIYNKAQTEPIEFTSEMIEKIKKINEAQAQEIEGEIPKIDRDTLPQEIEYSKLKGLRYFFD